MAGKGRALTVALIALTAAGLGSGLGISAARASGPGILAPWYLDQFGGDAADQQRLAQGQLGIVMARSPRPRQLVAWRLLHGLKVGAANTADLALPCCDPPPRPTDPNAPPTGVEAWMAARQAIPNAPSLAGEPRMEREGPNYTFIPTCFPDAFDTAAATLKDRAAVHGATSPEVAAWLATQDAVFRACHDTGVTPPPLAANAPTWLKVDRAYQEAALALYDGRTAEAATRFAAIGRDKTSPWRSSGLYLQARALERGALNQPSPAAFAAARKAIDALAAAPTGTLGQDRVGDMRRILAYRDQPNRLLAELDRQLNQVEPVPEMAVAFRDYANLSDRADPRPDAIDWMNTQATAPGDGIASARTRAQARWSATHDPAWLIAALGLLDPGDPTAGDLIAKADAMTASGPAGLSLRYHTIRLTLSSANPALSRDRLDAILARDDLTVSDRNIFTAQRAQVAKDLPEFARLALRRRLCAEDGCPRDRWDGDDYQPRGVYDGELNKGSVGLGEDARAVIDRLPLRERMALSREAVLPAKLRLDIALTSYARAVALQDNAAIDTLARDLQPLLPQLATDWKAIPATPSGADKRFAEFQILAKIPGLRFDLVDYTRPEGSVAEFQDYWTNWALLPAGQADADARPAPLAAYQQGGTGVEPTAPDERTDLTCLGECGRGAAPLRLPDFAAAAQPRAVAERARLYRPKPSWEFSPPAKPAPPPAGATFVWDEMLTYAQSHPKDPRVPETLYWLVHVGRFGGSHDHSGRRAFKLLHQRYGETSWAKKTPYFYD
ncbi:MAG: hypothetical protein P4L64_06245 [Caulobacteraceae bacterium]|nr:hypothetical protein [Caulobacteraceae bacterium]